jgi:hypothetical protein
MTAVWRYSQAPDMSALLILLAMADWADDDGYCFPSQRALAVKTGASVSTVKRALRAHVARGEVEREPRGHQAPTKREFIGRTGFKPTTLYRIALVDQLGSRRPEFLARNAKTNSGHREPVTPVTVSDELRPTTTSPIRSTRQIDTSEDTSEVQAGALPLLRPVEHPDDNVGVITRIAHEVIDQIGPQHEDLADAIKGLCARRHIAYDSTVVRKAIESAVWQRRHKAQVG